MKVETIPCIEVHVDPIARYTVRINELDEKSVPNNIHSTAMICIDPATWWFDIVQVPDEDKSFAQISLLLDQTWLSIYPRPKRVRFDSGSGFKWNFVPLIKDIGITPKSTIMQPLNTM